MDVKERVLKGLDSLGIAYEAISHPPAHTMEQCAEPAEKLGGVMPKNLFLRPRRQEEFYLCVTRPDAVYKASVVSRQAGASRLGFASGEELFLHLLAQPGSASPLGLMFDEAKDVCLLVDEALKGEKRLVFHPCDNTCSVALSGQDFFEKFLSAVGHEAVFVSMEESGAAE